VVEARFCTVKLGDILRDSFRTLLDQPKMFIPRLVSTSISTLWVLSLLGFSGAGGMSLESLNWLFYLGSAPLIMFLGVFVSVMLAEMVAENPSLRKAFSRALSKWKTLVLISGGLLISTLLIYLPVALGLTLAFISGQVFFIWLGFIVSLILLFGFSIAIFFLPVSVSEGGGLMESVLDSAKTSRTNSREVTALTLFSFLLLGVAFLMQGALQTIGVIGFVLSRFVSAVTTTYILVVSPKMYVADKE
jgi:hypothetical protein